MNEQTIRADGLELATQSFGNPAHPPMLLIMGGMASMLWWPDGFCRRLAARGRFVIRYDQRDTGLSSKFAPGRPGYGFEDAVDDVFRLLDGYGLSAAHVVGFSMGGMIGQGAALTRPERVLSLTVISSTPIGMDRSQLPKSGEAWLQHMAVEVDWSDRAATVAYEVEDARLIAGTAYGFDESGTRAFVEKDFDRSGGYLNATNHIVLLRGGELWRGRLGDLRAPLLVIHGTADPVFPMEHGVQLSGAVAGARLMKLEGGGHELHPGHWDRIVEAIAEHTGSKRGVDRR
ncbi:pimeloyl-ACP methyl ester carboxylesterase [Bradyrhizobium sp. AZCC 1719]|uniref:alpha/beta fold hydrolase n=1 Tax=Bradyrhizobium sp. AZCC 1719 TaxID=3117028 RepID=UPI002FEF5684